MSKDFKDLLQATTSRILPPPLAAIIPDFRVIQQLKTFQMNLPTEGSTKKEFKGRKKRKKKTSPRKKEIMIQRSGISYRHIRNQIMQPFATRSKATLM